MDLISTAGRLDFSNSSLSGSHKLQVPVKLRWPFSRVLVEQAQRWPYDLVQQVHVSTSSVVQERLSMEYRLPQLVACRGSSNCISHLFPFTFPQTVWDADKWVLSTSPNKNDCQLFYRTGGGGDNMLLLTDSNSPLFEYWETQPSTLNIKIKMPWPWEIIR